MNSPESYTIQVRRIEIEGETCFRASVLEFPDLQEFADTAADAYSLAIDAIELYQRQAAERKLKIPSPYVDGEFSGRISLRLPKHLHRNAATLADLEGVSLNTWLVAAIAEATAGRLVALNIQATAGGAVLSTVAAPNESVGANAQFSTRLLS